MIRSDIPAERDSALIQDAANTCEPTDTMCRIPKRRDRLAGERDYLLARLAKVNAAIAALDSSPQLAELVELIESV